MSEIVNTPRKTQKIPAKALVGFLSLALLLLVYGAGIFVLPISLLASYHSQNCDSVLVLHKIYTNLYPDFIEDKTLSSPAQECEAYARAASKEAKGSWQEAYKAYQAYATTYPNGLYTGAAHEHSALVLMSIVKDQIDQKNYGEAVLNLNLVLSGYADTGVSAEAGSLFPSTYTSWETGLRESGDFAGSEKVLNDFKAWSQSAQKTDVALDVQREFAQTYLVWGLDFQSQKQFEDALAKFELAASADPQSQFDSATQVRASQSSLYREWGNDLLEQDEFSAAIEKFELAVSRSEGDTAARDALANGHIQWAHALSADEDFRSALEQLNLAAGAAATDDMKQSVDAALKETYLAFSNSSSLQAQRAIKDALVAVCEGHKKPDLPIFGLTKDLLRVGIYGTEQPLPEELSARTPGELHYVACIVEEKRTIGTDGHYVIVKIPGGITGLSLTQYRVKIFWHVSIRKVDTAEEANTEIFEGSPPPPFPGKWADFGNGYYYGKPPSILDVAQWIEAVTK